MIFFPLQLSNSRSKDEYWYHPRSQSKTNDSLMVGPGINLEISPRI